MSQAGTFEAGNPGIADVQTLTGNTGGAVGPDGAGNINVVGDGDFITIAGNAGTNTLTVSLIQNEVFTAQTVDATPTPLGFIGVGANSAISIVCDVLGAQDDYSNVCSGVIQGAARRAGAGTTLVGIPSIWNSADDFATADFDIVVSGNNIVLQVTGEAATTINWIATIRYNVLDV